MRADEKRLIFLQGVKFRSAFRGGILPFSNDLQHHLHRSQLFESTHSIIKINDIALLNFRSEK